MTVGTASTFLLDPNKPPDLSKPMFKFDRTDWMDPPVFKPIDQTLSDSIYRRRANDALYQQISSPAKWQKYVTLGYFAIDDGAFFDLEWSAREVNPTKMHSIIWYNYLYYIDRDIDIPTKLNAWATQVSQPYLINNAPQLLTIDTTRTSWKQTQQTHTPMEIEDDQWTEVISEGKAKATKKRVSSLTRAAKKNPYTNIAPGFNLPENDTPRTSMKPTTVNQTEERHTDEKNTPTTTNNEFSTWLNNRTSTDNTPAWAAQTTPKDQSNSINPPSNTGTTPGTRVHQNPVNTYTPHPNKKINDGTHRITIKWKLSKNYLARLEENEDELIYEIHQLITHAFVDEDGLAYPWKSNVPQTTKPASTLQLDELKQFLSPKISFIKATSLLIFGLRFGFSGNPSNWKFKQNTQQLMKSHHFNVSISNSTCDSGNMVTVGYILLKAPNTTNQLYYLQHLTNQLPDNTPFFDLIRLRTTPMDQEINHIGVKCGERHATSLCHALTQYLTGNKTALFLPRYSLGSMTDEQIKQQFEFHERYTKSLRALSLSPHVSNLDRIRKETFPDGTSIERSTREWAAQLVANDNSPALCDVVNGGHDQKANLLVPSPYYDHIKSQYKEYKTRLNPTQHREARFRASISDLPDVIHITANAQTNMAFITNLANMNAWQPLPTQTSNNGGGKPQVTSQVNPSKNFPTRPQWQKPIAPYNNNKKFSNTSSTTNGEPSHTSDDQSLGSTQSMTIASNITTQQARIHELEASLHKQQTEIDSSSKTTSAKLISMESQFKRLDHLDTKITDMSEQLNMVTQQQDTQSTLLQSIKTDTHHQIKEMGASLVNSFTSQSKMANSMMTMQERIDKITELMQKLTNRLDHEQTKIGTAPNDDHSASPSSTHQATSSDPQSVQQMTTHTGTSQSSSSGSFTDLCYNSPQKKKIRSPNDGSRALTTTKMKLCQSDEDNDNNSDDNSADNSNDNRDDNSDDNSDDNRDENSDDNSDDNTTITTTTSNKTESKQLKKRLFSQKESQQSLASIFHKKAPRTGRKNANQALLDTQYKSQSDPDGAASI